MHVTLAHPLGFEVDHEVLDRAAQVAGDAGGSLQVVNDMHERGARRRGALRAFVGLARSTGTTPSAKRW
jgi:hypothetical protein